MVINQLLTSSEDPNAEQLKNLSDLLNCLNLLERDFGQPLVPIGQKANSGFRCWRDQVRIYKEKNDALKKAGKDQVPVPLHSSHLDGCGVDLPDPKGKLQSFLLFQRESVLATYGLYYEDFDWTKGYVHAQSTAPKSRKRFFLPYG